MCGCGCTCVREKPGHGGNRGYHVSHGFVKEQWDNEEAACAATTARRYDGLEGQYLPAGHTVHVMALPME